MRRSCFRVIAESYFHFEANYGKMGGGVKAHESVTTQRPNVVAIGNFGQSGQKCSYFSICSSPISTQNSGRRAQFPQGSQRFVRNMLTRRDLRDPGNSDKG
jgi:hypothetical protein